MGGGDLNTKKSWHPNTMKNQERVWKAEQAAAQEKQRIVELQRERAEERDRAELNEMAKRNAGGSNDTCLNWMYDKPDKKVHQEDYLLGKAIDKNYDQPVTSDQDVIPAVARRVVGSSMLATAGDAQVDLARKIREDPLLLVKERERAARAALLNNPLHRRRLAELLKKEQEQKNEKKTKKKSKKNEKNLDNMLATKLSALGSDKGIDLAALLASDDSSSETSPDEHTKKKKKKKRKKSKKSKQSKKSKETSSDSSDNESSKHKLKEKDKKISKVLTKYKSPVDTDTESDCDRKVRRKSKDRRKHQNTPSPHRSDTKAHKIEGRKRKSESCSDNDIGSKRSRRDHLPIKNKDDRNKKTENDLHRDSTHKRAIREQASVKSTPKRDHRKNKSYSSSDEGCRRDPSMKTSPKYNKSKNTAEDNWKRTKSSGLTEEEKAAKLAAMAAAGAEREVQRGRRVAEQRAADAAESTAGRRGPAVRNEARTLPDSLESRIHSNRHYIQRDRRHMNEHFARR